MSHSAGCELYRRTGIDRDTGGMVTLVGQDVSTGGLNLRFDG